MVVRVGLIGTSWWADAMYAPPLAAHEQAVMVAVCGRNPATTAAFADRWGIERRFDDPIAMLDSGELDAVVVASSNESHFPLTMAALDRGLHVLCEKPLAQNAAQAQEMAARAEETGAITLVPFTYHYMPVNQWVRRLIADGYVGRPYHVNLRYYTGYAYESAYSWRFDRELAGSGVIGDLASHWIHLARWLLDDTEVSVGALASAFVERGPRPDGGTYEQAEDSAVLTVRYASGAYGVLQVCAVSWEGTPFNQTHYLEVHGDAGTIYAECDWDTVQEVRGVRRGERGPGDRAADPRRHLERRSPRQRARHVPRRLPGHGRDDARMDHRHHRAAPHAARLRRRARRPTRRRRGSGERRRRRRSDAGHAGPGRRRMISAAREGIR